MGSTLSPTSSQYIPNEVNDEKKEASLHDEVAFPADQQALKAGYLLKRGFKNFASWKRRYCILLCDGYFNYYNSKRKMKGSVNFGNAHQCISCSKDNKKFFVLTSKRTFEFKGKSKNEAMEWIQLIQKITNNNQGNNNNQTNNVKLPTESLRFRHSGSYHRHHEFDSEDEDDNKSYKSSSSYIEKHHKRRSIATNLSMTETNDYITFVHWKNSIMNALLAQKINTNNNNDKLYAILKDDNKLKKIFHQITNSKKYMSMKQYITSMSITTKSKTEIESIATRLLSADPPQHSTQHSTQQSIISTLSYFDDTQSVISELSQLSQRRRRSTYHTNTNTNLSNYNFHSNKASYYEEFAPLQLHYYQSESFAVQEMDNEDDEDDEHGVDVDVYSNIRVEVPVNPAAEILGNFLGASCGLCVPGLDVITSIDSAQTYKLLSQYNANIDGEGKQATLLVYEELDGVSLADLKKQLEVVSINTNKASNSNTTTQDRIQKYFVSVVRKTFGINLPYNFSHDGRSMIRDAGFVFAVDMFLFNISRFPVLLPFEGKSNANNLFISTDEDGDSALYGLQNRFMGGHDIIEMPLIYFVNKNDSNSSSSSDNSKSIKLLKSKQQQCTQQYIGTLQKFLSVLSDYYQTKISPHIDNKNINNNDPTKLLHDQPRNTKINRTRSGYTKINHKSIIDKCLRPIANYLYIHCGFELIIIDEYDDNDSNALKIFEIYRNKLIDHMITLLIEGILIGISEISDQLEIKDIDIIIQDIQTLDDKMFGIDIIDGNFLKLVLRLYHSTAVSFQLNIEESSSDECDDI